MKNKPHALKQLELISNLTSTSNSTPKPKSQTTSDRSRSRKEFGGSLSLGRRRGRRPLSVKSPLHLVLKSDFATGRRSLVRHRPLIDQVLKKASKRFHVRVYEKGVAGNHIHLAVRGKTREGLQNFFRVVAGHIAQEILSEFPIRPAERSGPGGAPTTPRPTPGGAPGSQPKPKRDKANKFWQTRIYSRVVSWGRDYAAVLAYVVQNHLEGLGLIPYRERKSTTVTKRVLARKTKNTS